MRIVKLLACLAIFSFVLIRTVPAQLPSETRKVFEQIVDELDEDLKKLFIKAMDQNTATIEFTPEQFKRFRAHQANPFEGLDQVDADALEDNISLKFELPSVRNRSSGALERQHPKQLADYAPALKSWNESIVKIQSGDRPLSLGTVISREGYILTKASEVKDHKKLVCIFADQSHLDAELQGVDQKNDIAVLKVAANDLSPIQFASELPQPGEFLVTGNQTGKPIAIGVCSNHVRSLLSKNPGFLGVRPIDSTDGVKIDTVTDQGAADRAGIKSGDIIKKIDGLEIKNVTQMVNKIRQMSPGDKLVIEYSRNKEVSEAVAKLNGRSPINGSTDKDQSSTQFGAVISSRKNGFPLVIQHDTPLLPEQCGGPIVDLDGRVVGINIARHGRVGSYALPGSHVKKIVEKLLRRDVASRTDK